MLRRFLSVFLSVVSILSADEVCSTMILGGGIGALTSALYLGRAGLHPLVIEGKLPGGLLTQSHSVQNWPGEMEIEGALLTEKMREQAEANGVLFASEEVVSVDFSQKPFVITTRSLTGKGKTVQRRAESCIIAMGTEPNLLHIPGETGKNGYWGRGVSNCAICDGSLYAGKKVGVVGGGDAAVLEALYLSNIAKEVAVFVRKDKFRALEQNRLQTLLAKPNIQVFLNTQVVEIKGDKDNLQSVVLQTGGKKKEKALDGLFLAIGSTPNSRLFQGILEMDPRGYILVQKGQETSVKGVYAVGDIVDPVYKQAATAAGDAAKAALEVQQYLSDRVHGLAMQNKDKEPSLPTWEVVEIRSGAELIEAMKGGLPTFVDFYASWCGPCKKVAPIFAAAAERLGGKVQFLKVNVEVCRELSEKYGIRSMPTVLVFDSEGELAERKIGLGQIVQLLEEWDATLY